ncbi:MAG: metallophosphoesterase, partial [Desulfobacteraceae bacterium]|nr:metallophosphoesterase [Desulfobacteraceae bacterium]
MILNIIRFLSVVLLITLTTHYFLFFSWTRFFNINSSPVKLGLSLIVFFLSITFILSSIFIHISNNPFTRAYYLFSGTWLGLMSFLLIMTAFIWLIKGGLWFLPNDLPAKTIIQSLSCFLYGIAIIYTGFCHCQFYKIEIKYINVPIKNLPLQWEGKKIIHLSDLHLGGTKDLKFLKELVSLTNDQNAYLILITGDLFDGATNSQGKYIPYLNNFKAEQGVLFTSGNHEIYSGVEKSRSLIEKSKIVLLDNKAVVIDGLQILGISYPEFKNTSSFDFKDPKVFTKNLPTILLYHTPTSIKANGENLAEVRSSDYLAPDTTFSFAISQGISLQLSGHTHAGQFFPFTWVADKVFKGLHYGLHKIDDFYINISSGTGSWGPPLRSGYLSEIVVIT